jgi:hypothetical protein
MARLHAQPVELVEHRQRHLALLLQDWTGVHLVVVTMVEEPNGAKLLATPQPDKVLAAKVAVWLRPRTAVAQVLVAIYRQLATAALHLFAGLRLAVSHLAAAGPNVLATADLTGRTQATALQEDANLVS